MPLYRVSASVVGSKYLGVLRAKDKDEAEEKAFHMSEAYASLCHQCARQCEDAEIDEIHLEEITEADLDSNEEIEG